MRGEALEIKERDARCGSNFGQFTAFSPRSTETVFSVLEPR